MSATTAQRVLLNANGARHIHALFANVISAANVAAHSPGNGRRRIGDMIDFVSGKTVRLRVAEGVYLRDVVVMD